MRAIDAAATGGRAPDATPAAAAASSSASPSPSARPPLAPAPPSCVARVSCLVKLGGALITDKSKPETLRPEALRQTCRHLAEVYRQGRAGKGKGNKPPPPPPLVVVHGAGSFGHPTAREYGVARGGDLISDARLREGFCLTRLRVSKLHAAVVEALLDAGVPAAGLPPFAAPWGPTDGPGNVAAANARDACARVADCLDAGLVPVLFGDMVLDTAQGCSVLGGDALMRELARALAPRRAVFLTDVDGVFDRPPDEEGARLVRAVRVGGGGDDDDESEWVLEDAGGGDGGGGGGGAFSSSLSAVRLGGAADGAADVSGGMRAKVEEAAAISREAGGAPVVVARGGTEAAREALLNGAGAFLGESGGDGDGAGSGGARLRATVVMAAARRPGPPGA